MSGVAALRWALDPAAFFEDAVGSSADDWQARLLSTTLLIARDAVEKSFLNGTW